MKITYSRQAKKTLKRMPTKMAQNILAHIEKVAQNPVRTDMDIKKLQGRNGYRLRVGDYRVIYTAEGFVLAVEKIGPRGDVYK